LLDLKGKVVDSPKYILVTLLQTWVIPQQHIIEIIKGTLFAKVFQRTLNGFKERRREIIGLFLLYP
jgi:hypothetical protein